LPVRHRLHRLRHAPTPATADNSFNPRQWHLLGDVLLRRLCQLWIAHRRAIVAAAHSWQHLGRHALAALANVYGPSAAGATVRTVATAAFATAAADAPPLVAPARMPTLHRSPRRDGSIRLPALDGLLRDGLAHRTVGGAVWSTAFEHDARRDARSTWESARKVAAGMCSMESLPGYPPQLRQDGERGMPNAVRHFRV